MKKPTVPQVIWALYVFWAIVLVFWIRRPTKYELNGAVPSSDYIHSEIQKP